MLQFSEGIVILLPVIYQGWYRRINYLVAPLISPELIDRDCCLERISDANHWIFPLNLARVSLPHA